MPRQPRVGHGCAGPVVDPEIVLEQPELAIGATMIAQRRAARSDGVAQHVPDGVDQPLSACGVAAPDRVARVEARRRGERPARCSASQT